jgi:hypothetical protein
MVSPDDGSGVVKEQCRVLPLDQCTDPQALGRILGNTCSARRLKLLRDISSELDYLEVSDATAEKIYGALQLSMRLAGLAHAEREHGHRATDAKLGEAVNRLCQRVHDAGQPPEVAWYLIEHASEWLCAVPPAVTVPKPAPIAERVAELFGRLPRRPANV